MSEPKFNADGLGAWTEETRFEVTRERLQEYAAATNDPIARSLNMEWQGPTLYEGTGQLFFLQVAVFLASLYLSRRRLRPTEILLVLAFGYLALTSLRNVLWWAWVTAPIMAANFAAWAELRRAGRPAPAAEPEDAGDEVQVAPARSAEMPVLNWMLVAVFAGGALLFTRRPSYSSRVGTPLGESETT